MTSFFFNDTATTEIYTLSLHDALPICVGDRDRAAGVDVERAAAHVLVERQRRAVVDVDRRPRRHGAGVVRSEEHTSELQYANISYAVFCLKKKKIRDQYYLLVPTFAMA